MTGKRGKIKIMLVVAGITWILYMEPQTVRGMEYIEAVTEEAEIQTETETQTEMKLQTEMAEAESEETEQMSTEIVATELDLGDYQSKMTVGQTQLLAVTVIPVNATEQTVVYSAGDTSIAKINGLGRITALAAGETKITARCGSVENSFMLKVEEAETEEETECVGVADIEIGDYEEELEVGKTLNLSVTVLPQNATNGTVTYYSGDSAIAKVNSSGEIKGVSKGKTVIYCSAGYVTKEIPITVKVATEKLCVNNNYLVMKPGGAFTLQATVTPAEATQEISYQALDTSIATVSPDGIVSAKACGSTSVLVSNGDSTISVSVIVNETETAGDIEEEQEKVVEPERTTYEKTVSADKIKVITAEMLKYFYDEKSILIVEGEDYRLYVDGNSVVNYKNELYTELALRKEEEGYSFVLNRGEALCGPITLKLEKRMGNYLYLYNNSKERYELIETDNMQALCLTSAGKYLITEEKMALWNVDKRIMGMGGAGVAFLMGTYIVRKRKYWFW